MDIEPKTPKKEIAAGASDAAGPGWDLLRSALLAIIGGLAIGAVGTGFRLILDYGTILRGQLIRWTDQSATWGWLVPMVVSAVVVAVARWLVKRYAPLAGGSGVQHVEAVMRGEAAFAPLAVLPVKFVGGALAIGSGMALGREGPVVQMGSAIGGVTGRLSGLSNEEARDLQAAVAGAGLATAFNAPLGGALFVFEELARRFTLRLLVATLVACGIAVTFMRDILGNHQEFKVPLHPELSMLGVLPCIVLGGFLGVIGAAYNWIIIRALTFFDDLKPIPVEVSAAAVGALVGLIAWFDTGFVGGGEDQVQQVFDGRFTLSSLGLLFAVRWVLGPLCYATGTPGGVFAPLLLVGATFGAVFGNLLGWLPFSPGVTVLATVGMAAFFTAVVRAPLTGILLTVEMTGSAQLIVPLLFATAMATLVPALLGSEPIYDTLRNRMLAQSGSLPTGLAASLESEKDKG